LGVVGAEKEGEREDGLRGEEKGLGVGGKREAEALEDATLAAVNREEAAPEPAPIENGLKAPRGCD